MLGFIAVARISTHGGARWCAGFEMLGSTLNFN